MKEEQDLKEKWGDLIVLKNLKDDVDDIHT